MTQPNGPTGAAPAPVNLPRPGRPPAPPGAYVTLNPKEPSQCADKYVTDFYGHAERARVLYYANAFYSWTDGRWTRIPDADVDKHLHDTFKTAVWWGTRTANGTPDWNSFEWNNAKFSEIRNALKRDLTVTHVNTATGSLLAPPVWVNATGRESDIGIPANECVVARNGILHTATRCLYSHTPRLFSDTPVGYGYDAAAPEPVEWLRFLSMTFPEDQASIDLLQEIFGYLVTRRTDHHKVFMFIGQPRTGKSTMITVLEELLGGGRNIGEMDANSLNNTFGLETFIGNTITVSRDDEFDLRHAGTAIQRIKAISGEDKVQVQIKNKPSINMRLATRLVFVSNNIPSFVDESGALARRFVFLKFSHEVADENIDRSLRGKILNELPAILNWALDGLARLNSKGVFSTKGVAEDLASTFRATGGTTRRMVEELCVLDPTAEVSRKEYEIVVNAWRESENLKPRNSVWLSRDLAASIPEVVTGDAAGKSWINGRRLNVHSGLRFDYEKVKDALGDDVMMVINYKVRKAHGHEV